MKSQQAVTKVIAYIVRAHLCHLLWIAQHGFHGCLVKRPGVDVRVDVVVACRSVQKGFAQFPVFTGVFPRLAGCLDLCGGQTAVGKGLFDSFTFFA